MAASPRTIMLPLFLFLAGLVVGSAHPQDPPAPPALGGAAEKVLLASDGEPVAAGRIPDGTSDEALARWRKALAATQAAALPPITSFDLTFEIDVRHASGFNQTDAGFLFLDHPQGPYLRATLRRKDRESLRGPKGDYLIEAGTAQKMQGRHFAEDRRQLDEWISIARNVLALTKPDGVRVVSLEAFDTLPAEDEPNRVRFAGHSALPFPDTKLAEEARGLDWLLVKSPDFRLYETGGTNDGDKVYRALMGMDRTTGEVRFAVLHEDVGRLDPSTALLVAVRRYAKIDPGYHVPGGLELRRAEPVPGSWAFEARPQTTLWLKRGGSFNPVLTPADFLP